MIHRFSGIYEQLLKEIDVKNIGIFPGKFKPPHKGHFYTAKKALTENDILLVLISSKPHEGITPENSFNIWNIYKKYLGDVFPVIVNPTPVLASLELTNILNNGEYKPQNEKPKSNALEIISNNKVLESFVNVGNGININFYASQEDTSRFNSAKKPLYSGNNVLKVDIRPIERITSATAFREAIKHKDANVLNSFLPEDLSQEDKAAVIKNL
jgi:cytidyltransferase-like protein